MLDSVKRTIRHYLHTPDAAKAEESSKAPCQFTVEELNREQDEAEVQEGGVPSEMFFAELEQEHTRRNPDNLTESVG